MSKKKTKGTDHSKGKVQYTLVFSDTDNDLHSVKYVLWLTGLCNRHGIWRKGVRHFCVVHTGDWINKRNPDPEVLAFFHALKTSAPESCNVILLLGNHEVEVLQRMAAGVRTRLNSEDLAFIRQQDVLHVSGKVLYIHGYPTIDLLSILVQIKKEGVALNAFNQRFRKALHEGRYALFKNREGLEIIGDIRNVKQYYIRGGGGGGGETNGERVSRLLQTLNIDIVIHGHRPNVLIQLDYELQDEVPGIRIINNDNKVKMTGVGSVVVDSKNYVRFINPKAMRCLGGESAFRKRIRMVLGTDKKAKEVEWGRRQSSPESDVHTVCLSQGMCLSAENGLTPVQGNHKTILNSNARVSC